MLILSKTESLPTIFLFRYLPHSHVDVLIVVVFVVGRLIIHVFVAVLAIVEVVAAVVLVVAAVVVLATAVEVVVVVEVVEGSRQFRYENIFTGQLE